MCIAQLLKRRQHELLVSPTQAADGRIGKWKEVFPAGDLEIVQGRFAEFGIPMSLFTME